MFWYIIYMLRFITWNLQYMFLSNKCPLFASNFAQKNKSIVAFLSSHYNRTLAEWPNVSSLFDPSRCLPCDSLNLGGCVTDGWWFRYPESNPTSLRLVVEIPICCKVLWYVQKVVVFPISITVSNVQKSIKTLHTLRSGQVIPWYKYVFTSCCYNRLAEGIKANASMTRNMQTASNRFNPQAIDNTESILMFFD